MASTAGAMMRQGPHHSAQKSTSTGFVDFKTSASKFSSVNVNVFLPAILLEPPMGTF
jgi:hypothetical protein